MCDLSGVLSDTPELTGSVAVLSCPCGQSRALQEGDRAAAVVLGARSQDRLSKLLWLLRLRFGVWQAGRLLARQGIVHSAALAAWPSLERSMIVYDIGTSAAGYAESRVLPGSRGRLGRLLRLASGVDMSVDVVVVFGVVPDAAPAPAGWSVAP